MALTRTQEMLIYFLKKHSVTDRDAIIGIALALHKSEAAMEDLILWMEETNPTREQIFRKMIELHNNLPTEQKVMKRVIIEGANTNEIPKIKHSEKSLDKTDTKNKKNDLS